MIISGVTTVGNYVKKIDRDGAIVWTRYGDEVAQQLAVGPDGEVFGRSDTAFFKLSATGELIWSVSELSWLTKAIDFTALDDGNLVVVGTQFEVVQIGDTEHSEQWPTHSTVSGTDGSELHTGRLPFEIQSDGSFGMPIVTGVAASGDYIVFVGSEGEKFALDRRELPLGE